MPKRTGKYRLSLFQFVVMGCAFADSYVTVFDDPHVLNCDTSTGPALMKAAISGIDWLRQGESGARWNGAYWIPSRTNSSGVTIMKKAGRSPFDASVGNLDDNGYDDAVYIEGDRFVWVEDCAKEGRRDFDRKKRKYLQFVYGGDLKRPETLNHLGMHQEMRSNVVLHDWDQDGLCDLIVCVSSSGFTPYSKVPDSRYVPQGLVGPGHGWENGGWVFGDLRSTVWWYRNVGTLQQPLFSDARLMTAGICERAITFPNFMVHALPFDWNRDNAVDLVVSTANRVIVFLNQAESHQQPVLDDGRQILFNGSPDLPVMRIAAPKRDESGRLGLNFTMGGPFMEAWQLDTNDLFSFGAAQFVLFEDPVMQTDVFPVPCMADWNGDGRQDIVFGGQDGWLMWHRNLGAGRWSAVEPLHENGHPLLVNGMEALQGPIEHWWGYSAPVVYDFDSDGDLDLLLGNQSYQFIYIGNTGTIERPDLRRRGWVLHPDGSPVKTGWRTRPALADLTGDGVMDLAGQNMTGHLVIWPGAGIQNNAPVFGQPITLKDRNGYPYIMGNNSRDSGRTVLSAVEFTGDGRTDIIASPFMSTRSTHIWLFRNVTETGGRPAFEFEPGAIRLEGVVPPEQFSHYRMLNLIGKDSAGNWEGISGVDRGALLHWKSHREPVPDGSLSSAWAGEKAAFDHTVPVARLDSATAFGETGTFREGAPVFQNRPWTFTRLPEELIGFDYVLSPLEFCFALVREKGTVYVLIPEADGFHRETTVPHMKSRGYELVDISPFQLFGDDPLNRVVVMKKDCTKGEKLVFGKWCIILSSR